MARMTTLSKKERRRRAVARARKDGLALAGKTIVDLQHKAGVTYSFAEKWVNARRASAPLLDLYEAMTGRRDV